MADVNLEPRDSGQPIAGWWLPATCPHCAGQLAHVAAGRPDGYRSRTITRCGDCGRPWAVQVVITDVSKELGRRHKRPGSTTDRDLVHGRLSTYRRGGCRCDECRDTSNTERRKRRDNQRRRGAA